MHKSGFTLLELSIVLVIIGLVVGGILVGHDLINSAKRQNVIKEATSLQQAILAFRLKYNSLPGDMTNPDEFFGPYTWIQTTPAYRANGNGIIVADYEGADAWNQLNLASLVAGGINGSTPISSYSDRGVWSVGVNSASRVRNVLVIGGTQGQEWNARPLLPSLAAFTIDAKMDDGLPETGNVVVESRLGPSQYGAGSGFDDCTTATSDGEYLREDAAAACAISFPLNQ